MASNMILAQQRRTIFDRVSARYAAKGIALDHPVYLALMESWIAGEIEMKEATDRWNSAREKNVDSNPAPIAHRETEIEVSEDTLTADLIEEIESAVKSWPAFDEPDDVRP